MKKSNDIICSKISVNRNIVFSTISKTIVEMTDNEYSEYMNSDYKNCKILSDEILEFLKDNYFILEDNADSSKVKNLLFDKDRLSPKTFSTYITFSTLCNFSCVYCYEQGITLYKVMDDTIMKNVINWYKKILKQNNYKKCKVVLFGGEPLLHKDLIMKFVTLLHKETYKLSIELNIGIITNGYLLDSEIINFLANYGLEEIQITIDGVKNVHNQRRYLKNGDGTFDQIIKNIINAPTFNGRFLIRISFDENNITQVEELINYISSLKTNNILDIYFAPIHQIMNQKDNRNSFCSMHTYSESKVLQECYINLYKKAKKLGFSVPNNYSNGPCMVVASDSCIIAPNGDLFKCVEMLGINELAIGNVNDKKYNSTYFEFVSEPPVKKCLKNNCKYALLCGGGCVMQKYLSNKSINDVDCHKDMFGNLTKEYLKINYGEELSKK